MTAKEQGGLGYSEKSCPICLQAYETADSDYSCVRCLPSRSVRLSLKDIGGGLRMENCTFQQVQRPKSRGLGSRLRACYGRFRVKAFGSTSPKRWAKQWQPLKCLRIGVAKTTTGDWIVGVAPKVMVGGKCSAGTGNVICSLDFQGSEGSWRTEYSAYVECRWQGNGRTRKMR